MSEKEAHELLEKAAKKASSTGWFGGNKYDEAAELYIRAANTFKLIKKHKEAGDAFCKAAELQISLKEPDEASLTFINASKCFKKNHPEDAIKSLTRAIGLLTDRGRFYTAATHQKDIAQIYETDLADVAQAMNSYEVAADWYSGEDSTALANSCLLKVATFAAQLEDYQKAIELFEKIAQSNLDNSLTRFSIKDYFLKAALCYLANSDVIGAQNALKRYSELDSNFSVTHEYRFLRDVVEAVEQGDVEAFTKHVYDFDQLLRLDNWKTTVLLRIKKSLEEEENELT